MLSLALHTKDDNDFASQFKWLMKRQAKELKVLDEKEQLALFCQLASSENHERNDCLSSKGETIGANYGHTAKSVIGLIDWIVGPWIKTGK